MECSTPGLPAHHQFPELTQTHVHWVSDAVQPSCPLSPPSPPDLSLSIIRVFSNESALHIRWPKYWSFNFSISPSSEYSGLISFKIDWLDLLAVQGTPCEFLFVGWLYIPIYICFLGVIINSTASYLQIILEWIIICRLAYISLLPKTEVLRIQSHRFFSCMCHSEDYCCQRHYFFLHFKKYFLTAEP